jgi:hypothetical protein
MIRDKVFRYEKYFFLLVILVNLFPVLSFSYFPTLDGPAHLYNANLIHELLASDQGVIQNYFCFRSAQFTNWTGQLIMIFFHLFLPAWIAEKLLIIIILVGLPYAFRGFIQRLGGERSLLTYMIFPFTWTPLFFNGFFNFLLGSIFTFVILLLWVSPHFRPGFRQWILLFLLFLLAAGSHIFAFILAASIAGGWTLWTFLIAKLKQQESHTKFKVRQGIIKLGFLFTTTLGGLFILVYYLAIPNYQGTSDIKDIAGSLNDIRMIKPLIVMFHTEQMFTTKWFYWLCLMSLIALIIRLPIKIRFQFSQVEKDKIESRLRSTDYLLMLTILFLPCSLFIIIGLKQDCILMIAFCFLGSFSGLAGWH